MRRGDQRLLEREVHAETGQRHRKRHRRRVAGARVDVGGEGHSDAARDQHARRREASELQIERRDRQQRRDDAGRGEPGGARVVDEEQMIRGPRADRRPRPPRRRLRPSSSAWMRGFEAGGRAGLRISRASSGVNTPVSQNTSHHSASRSRATAGNHLAHDEVDVRARGRSRYSTRHLVRAHERRRQSRSRAWPRASESPAASSARRRW